MSEALLNEPAPPNFLSRLRDSYELSLVYVGEIAELGWVVIQQMIRGPFEREAIIAQFEKIGVRSLSSATSPDLRRDPQSPTGRRSSSAPTRQRPYT